MKASRSLKYLFSLLLGMFFTIVSNRVVESGQNTNMIYMDEEPFSDNLRFTLDLRDTDLRDCLRMLGPITGRTINIDSSLPSASITAVFRNISAREFVDYLQKTYDIGYKMIAADKVLVGSREVICRPEVEETRVFHPASIDVVFAHSILSNWVRTSFDKLVLDSHAKTITATTYSSQLERVEKAIQTLDQPVRQILFYGRVIELVDTSSPDVYHLVDELHHCWQTGRSNLSSTPYIAAENAWRNFDLGLEALPPEKDVRVHRERLAIAPEGGETFIRLSDSGGRDDWLSSHTTRRGFPNLMLYPKAGKDQLLTVRVSVSTGQVLRGWGTSETYSYSRSLEQIVQLENGEPFVIGGISGVRKTDYQIKTIGLPLFDEIFCNEREKQAIIVIVPLLVKHR